MAWVNKPLRSRTGASRPDRIVVYGHDLVDEILGKQSLTEVAFLALTARKPSSHEAAVFGAIVITLVEHGMTPMAITTRLTHLSAPESLQGAVAAGLLGMGDRFGGGAEVTAALLRSAWADANERDDVLALAAQIVDERLRARRTLPGLGHHMHKPVDPRTPKLFEIARANGFDGRYVALLNAISAEAERRTGRTLPVNAAGAIGALCCELGLPDQAPRGIAVFARAIGLVGHLIEESRDPIAREIWGRAEAEVNANWFDEEPRS